VIPKAKELKLISVYLYTMNIEQRLKIKQIHNFVSEHLRLWFPLLPTYEVFNIRINRLSEALWNLAKYVC
jgi:hypothetical protein